MARCPECGGNMTSIMKRKTCESCGLSLSGYEYDKMWEKNRKETKPLDDKKQKERRDYLDWYHSSKK